ncbi:hypothetical protein ACFXTI_014473 [Malus domestica]
MGKFTTNLPVQNSGQEDSSQAQNPLIAVTPKATSATHQENEVGLGGLPLNAETLNRTKGVLIEDYDEDGGEGFDPPTRSFLWRRLEKKSQIFSQEVKSILEVIHSNGEAHNKMLELLVSKVYNSRPTDSSWQHPPKGNLVSTLQAETGFSRLKMIDLEKRGRSSSRLDESNQKEETTSVDVIEVQRMIDSTLKKGPKFLKFIHLYPAYVEKFEYPKCFKIPDFNLFAGKSSLSSLDHVARFTA